ncbi:hypothetical protein OUZ56_028159 [Daphnia magna]|uniref:Uncharacterized protein n=1 Tax=Daphnia magna TaxID=35525 RepID=A0ABR0B379_9CRUS|nr:hypothetical protein OUZ56_028159 [Daphnia magna]
MDTLLKEDGALYRQCCSRCSFKSIVGQCCTNALHYNVVPDVCDICVIAGDDVFFLHHIQVSSSTSDNYPVYIQLEKEEEEDCDGLRLQRKITRDVAIWDLLLLGRAGQFVRTAVNISKGRKIEKQLEAAAAAAAKDNSANASVETIDKRLGMLKTSRDFHDRQRRDVKIASPR